MLQLGEDTIAYWHELETGYAGPSAALAAYLH